MKAWTCNELGAPATVLSLIEATLPEPGPGELRVEVHCAGIGLPDALMCRGNYTLACAPPITPGQEFCGSVLAVGDGVSLQPGDRVMGISCFFNGQGALAQQCMSMETMVFKAPDSLNDAEAAAFTIPYHTAWVGLVERAALQAGETLLVHGAAGGCGAAAVQLGHALGARVIAVVSSEDKTVAARDWGADEVIDRRQQDFVEEVNKMTDSRGADVIFDPVGGEVCSRSVNCLANAGRLLAVGFASGEWGQPDTHSLVLKNAACLGVFVGAYSPDQRQLFHDQLLALYAQGKLTPPLQPLVEFDKVPQALAAVESGKVVGKLVVQVTATP